MYGREMAIRVLSIILFLHLLFPSGVLLAEETSVADIIGQMQGSYGRVSDYQCIYITYNLDGEKIDKRTVRYFFKKPGLIRVEGMKGFEKGWVAVYRDGKIRLKPKGFLFLKRAFLPLKKMFLPFGAAYTFDPDDRLMRSPGRGYRVDESGIDDLIARAISSMRRDEVVLIGREEVFESECYLIEMVPKTLVGDNSITKERLWVDVQTNLPLQYEVYEAGNRLVHSRTFKDLKVNIGLLDKLFKL